MSWLWLILIPPIGFLLHSLVGLLFFLLIYGVEEFKLSGWAIEIVAKPERIWGRPGAQTHGLVIFYATRQHRLRRELRVHERVHIIQCLLLGLVYIITYGLFFAFNFLVLANFLWRNENEPRWKRAYRRIPWEIWAYNKQYKYRRGEIPNAWGSKI